MDEKTGWLVGGASAVSLLVGAFSTKVVDAWLRVRKASMEERQYEDKRTDGGYKLVIAELKARVSTLEAAMETMQKAHHLELESLRKEHVECLKKQAELASDNQHNAKDIDLLRGEIESLRKWRHDVANAEHLASLAKEVGQQIETKTDVKP